MSAYIYMKQLDIPNRLSGMLRYRGRQDMVRPNEGAGRSKGSGCMEREPTLPLPSLVPNSYITFRPNATMQSNGSVLTWRSTSRTWKSTLTSSRSVLVCTSSQASMVGITRCRILYEVLTSTFQVVPQIASTICLILWTRRVPAARTMRTRSN